MFRNLFLAAVLAALCAGLANSAVQYFRVTPLILEAESFEAEPHVHSEGAAPHVHAEDQWRPRDGFERTALTVLFNLLLAAGFVLILSAVSVLANLPITYGNGAIWGLCGFLAASLAPAYGLAPELPGMPAGEVLPRQLWWFATTVSTGAAFLLLGKTRAPWAFAIAALLVVCPHLVGAPRAPDLPSEVPARLATKFAATAVGTAAVF